MTEVKERYALDPISATELRVVDSESGDFIGILNTNDMTVDGVSIANTELLESYYEYRGSSLYIVWNAKDDIESVLHDSYNTEQEWIDAMMTLYQKLITACCICLYGECNGSKRCDLFLRWLDETDFYTAPASTKYHDAFSGGLVKHHLETAYYALDLMESNTFHSSARRESIMLVSLIHDLCKVNLYEPYLKNVKDDTTGQWIKEQAFKHREAQIPLGHGAASLYIAQKFFKLDLEQALAIRWHMGKWNLCDGESAEYHSALKRYPMIYLIQFADQLTIKEWK